MSTRNPTNDAIRAQAAEFIIDDEDRSPEHEARLKEWLARSPKHVEEYMRISGVWETLADEEIISALPAPEPARFNTSYRWLAAAASVAILVVAGWWLATRPDTYRTAAGETLSFQLEDLSVVFMNSDAVLSVDYSKSQRRLTLATGQASFEVARDQERPLVVDSGPIRATVTGTEFIVERISERTTVSVMAGKVLVEGKRVEILDARRLGPAQKISVDDSGNFEVTDLGSEIETPAWRTHRVTFDSTRLDEVVRVFNRFNVTQIEIEEDIMYLRIGGVFDAGDMASLLGFLETLDDVSVRTAPDGTPTIFRSAAGSQ